VTHAGALIMVVDDDEDIRELAKLFLEIEGYRVTTARDGLDAWKKLRTSDTPSLILLDLMMPRMDGEHFIRALRASPLAHIPVVIMSGHGSGNDETRELKAEGSLLKPVELDDLMTTVRRFVPSDSETTGRLNRRR